MVGLGFVVEKGIKSYDGVVPPILQLKYCSKLLKTANMWR